MSYNQGISFMYGWSFYNQGNPPLGVGWKQWHFAQIPSSLLLKWNPSFVRRMKCLLVGQQLWSNLYVIRLIMAFLFKVFLM